MFNVVNQKSTNINFNFLLYPVMNEPLNNLRLVFLPRNEVVALVLIDRIISTENVKY